LTVINVRGHETVLIDDLVRWAAGRKMIVEQDALPGCEPLVAASYRRLHQQRLDEITCRRPDPADAPPPRQTERPPVKNKLKNRIFPMDAEIELAMGKALDSSSAASVWAALTQLAETKTGCMIGFTSEGIQFKGKEYQENDVLDEFTFKNLRDRMARADARKRK
jgi:hypothetical protein